MTSSASTGRDLDVLRIHAGDNVCVAVRPLAAGTAVQCAGASFVLAHDVRLGAKLALRPLRAGEKIFKYGEPIGTLTGDVPLGGYVHTHNLESDYLPTHELGAMLVSAPARTNESAIPRPTYRPPR